LGESKSFRKGSIPLGLFEGIELFPLQVFHESEDQESFIRHLTNHRRYFLPPETLYGSEATLASHQFVPAWPSRAHQERLEQTVLSNRGSELPELHFRKLLPGL